MRSVIIASLALSVGMAAAMPQHPKVYGQGNVDVDAQQNSKPQVYSGNDSPGNTEADAIAGDEKSPGNTQVDAASGEPHFYTGDNKKASGNVGVGAITGMPLFKGVGRISPGDTMSGAIGGVPDFSKGVDKMSPGNIDIDGLAGMPLAKGGFEKISQGDTEADAVGDRPDSYKNIEKKSPGNTQVGATGGAPDKSYSYAYGHREEKFKCQGKQAVPQCCELDVLGLLSATCMDPTTTPFNKESFKADCADEGKTAQCCVMPVGGQAVACHEI